MIGTSLDLVLPLLEDNLATIVQKTSDAISQIEVSIADDVTQAAINITGSLTMNGNWLTNVAGIVLADGNAPTAAGSTYYHDGEFYMVDSTGIVKVTLNGALNAAGFGAIGGDYGGVNPALVSYDTASGQYRFYIDGGALTFADLSAQSEILHGANGSVKLSVDASVVTNKVYPIGNLVATGALVWDGTKIATASSISTGWSCAALSCTTFSHSAAWEYNVPLSFASLNNVNLTHTTDDLLTANADNAVWRSDPFSMLRVGDTIVAMYFTLVKTTAAAALVSLKKMLDGGSVPVVVATFDTALGGTGVPVHMTWPATAASAIATKERWWVEIALAKNTDAIVNVTMAVTH